MADSGEHEVVLPSTFDAMQEVESFVAELKDCASLNKDDFDRILLATNEAVNNAIIHGNQEDPEKRVSLTAELQDQQLHIRVGDEGAGFKLQDTPNPLKVENLLKESGRGVFLIKESADEVYYSGEDNQLVMTFNLNSS